MDINDNQQKIQRKEKLQGLLYDELQSVIGLHGGKHLFILGGIDGTPYIATESQETGEITLVAELLMEIPEFANDQHDLLQLGPWAYLGEDEKD